MIKTKSILLASFLFAVLFTCSCKHEPIYPAATASDNLAIDSLRATKKQIQIWEEIWITAYTRGSNLTFNWTANHGSMLGTDSVTVKYWACPSCVGLNTVECKVSNEYGTVSDTIMIRVND